MNFIQPASEASYQNGAIQNPSTAGRLEERTSSVAAAALGQEQNLTTRVRNEPFSLDKLKNWKALADAKWHAANKAAIDAHGELLAAAYGPANGSSDIQAANLKKRKAETDAKYYLSHKSKRAEYQANYSRTHRDAINAYHRERRKAHKAARELALANAGLYGEQVYEAVHEYPKSTPPPPSATAHDGNEGELFSLLFELFESDRA